MTDSKRFQAQIHVEQRGLPISMIISPANIHNFTKFIDVIKSISNFVDKSYDANYIKMYLRNHSI